MPDLNIRGVNCRIAGDHDNNPGIVRRWTEYGPEISVRFMVAWNDCQNLAAALLGSIALNDDGSLSRIPPYKLPFAPKLYCIGIGEERPMTPRQDLSGWVYYELSEITATFGALTWQIEGSSDTYGQNDPSGLPYTTTKFRVSGETISPPTGTYYMAPFGSSAKPAEDALITIISPRVEISLTRYLQPRIPLDEAMTLVGIINDGTVRLANRTFPRGTILFTGMSTEPRNDVNGFPVQDIEYTFLGKFEAEFNEFLGTDGDLHFLNSSKDGTGLFPFEYGDFSVIFT